MYEEYVLDGILHVLNGLLSFRYSEFFLKRKHENRKKSLILWVAVYAVGQMLYGSLVESYSIYNQFSHIIPYLVLLGVLQFFWFERNISRQVFSVASFIAGWEILRFTASPLAHTLLGIWNPFWEWSIHALMAQGLLSVEMLMGFMETANRLALFVVLIVCRGIQLGVFYIYLKLITKNFVGTDHRLNVRENGFLLMPCMAILCMDLTLRLMAYSVDNSALMLVYDRVPETLILLPAASLFLLGFVVSSVILFRGLVDGKEEERKRLLLENRVAEIHAQMRELDSIYSDMRGLKHDLRAHIASIAAYVRNRLGEDAKELSPYLKGMEDTVARLDFADRTGNPLTDFILHQFRQQSKRREIDVSFVFHYPQNGVFDVYDISIILNNALQNAMDACGKVASSPYISLRSYEKGSLFFLEVENNFDGALIWKPDSDIPATTKEEPDLHGIGLDNIRRTARKYQGDIEICITEKGRCSVFLLTVMLYRKKDADQG